MYFIGEYKGFPKRWQDKFDALMISGLFTKDENGYWIEPDEKTKLVAGEMLLHPIKIKKYALWSNVHNTYVRMNKTTFKTTRKPIQYNELKASNALEKINKIAPEWDVVLKSL
jgi:hypothetical protein